MKDNTDAIPDAGESFERYFPAAKSCHEPSTTTAKASSAAARMSSR